MSLQALTTEVLQELQRTRELFGPAPQSAPLAGTAGLESARAAVAVQSSAATETWHGDTSEAYREAAGSQLASLGRTISADNALTELTTAAATASGHGREMMDSIVADTRRGIATIAPSTDTPAGRAQLVTHLQNQLRRARAVVDTASQLSTALSAQLNAAGSGYQPSGGATAAGSGPDDIIVGSGSPGRARIQMVDDGTGPSPTPAPPAPSAAPQIGPFPVPPQVAGATPAPPVTGDPIKLPPAPPRPVQVIDASPPDGAPPPQPRVGFPNCPPTDVGMDLGEMLVGGLGIAGGAVATPFTLGTGLAPMAAGAWAYLDGEYKLSKCK